MTISNTSRTAGPFVGNGTTTVFPFSYKVFTRADVLVAQTVIATGIETIKTLDADYSVTLNADQNNRPGGIITMFTAPPVGTFLAATSNIALAQALDLTNQGGFYPTVINDALDRIVVQIQQIAAKVGGNLNVGGAAAVQVIGQLATSAGSSLIGFVQSGIGAVLRTLQDKNRERVSPEDFGAKADGVTDDTAAIKAALAAIPVGGAVAFTSGKQYRITDTVTVNARSLSCLGKAEIVADLNDATKDATVLDATVVRVGTAQSYVPCGRMEGITVLVRSTLRDGIRIAYGDYPTLWRVDVQRDPNAAPVWRDGVHLESKGDQCFIENIDFRSVRVHDAGRSGFRFEVPTTGTNVFINVGNYDNCEVRGCGQATPGYPVHFVSLNTTATEKISSHTFTGGEYQTNSTATNPNPDGFRADKVAGGANVENIHINGATAECVPTNGTGLAVNTNAMTRVVLTNFLPFGFTGAATGVGGTGDSVTFGYLGLDAYVSHGTWTISLSGATTAGTPVVSFQKGIYTRVGKTATIAGQIQISSWGGAAGPILVSGLPANIKNDAFAFYSNVPSQINAVTLGTGYTYPVLRARYGTAMLALFKNGSAVNDAAINVADATAPFSLAFSLTYETD